MPNPLIATLTCTQERGRLRVDACLEVPEWPGVWGLCDRAFVPDPQTGGFHPPTAQHACRQGEIVARNIAATIRGSPKRPFTFKTLGQLAAIGRRSGVANVFGIRFSGFVAWWLWRSIYLSKLPRLERKLRVVLDWTLDLVFTKDIVQWLTSRGPSLTARVRSAEPSRT